MVIRKYTVEIHFVLTEEGGDGYYLAFLPDFGYSACSATGDSRQEALDALEQVQKEVIDYYLENEIPIPIPSIEEKPWNKK